MIAKILTIARLILKRQLVVMRVTVVEIIYSSGSFYVVR
jgi:hypothetical protein